MSLVRPLRPNVKKQLEDDPFMHKCCIADGQCKGVIQWHHHLKYSGVRSDNKEHILPLCEYHHSKADVTLTKEKIDWVWLNRLTDIQINDISKAVNYKQRKKYLNKKYGSYNHPIYSTNDKHFV